MIFYFHPYLGFHDPIWRAYVSNGLNRNHQLALDTSWCVCDGGNLIWRLVSFGHAMWISFLPMELHWCNWEMCRLGLCIFDGSREWNQFLTIYLGVSKNRFFSPKKGWFIMESPINMDDLGVFPLFLETPICVYIIIYLCACIYLIWAHMHRFI